MCGRSRQLTGHRIWPAIPVPPAVAAVAVLAVHYLGDMKTAALTRVLVAPTCWRWPRSSSPGSAEAPPTRPG
ncbi:MULTISPECIES: hypothetical protein [Pseudonocardia]|uniref:hypothetical protein n=1 Tax=Pseudonocardia TaxID=1847 RepID=UPI000A28AA5C|nr:MULTISPECIES: hypothetical protein [Pseudonocardia]